MRDDEKEVNINDNDADKASNDADVNIDADDEADNQAEAENASAGANDAVTVEELQDKLQRTLAELENTRRRFDRDKQESVKYAIAGFTGDILSLADNLDRALQAVPKGELDSAFANFVQGVELSAKELNSIFERNNIKKIAPVGEQFSANKHQAVSEIVTDEYPVGTVVDVLQPGYILHDRLIRPAMVVVAKAK